MTSLASKTLTRAYLPTATILARKSLYKATVPLARLALHSQMKESLEPARSRLHAQDKAGCVLGDPGSVVGRGLRWQRRILA